MKLRSRKIWAWAAVLTCWAVIYGTLPVSARIYNDLVKAVPLPAWLNACAWLLAFSLAAFFLKKCPHVGRNRFFAFSLLLTAYLYFILRTPKPDEKIHFIAYGAMGFLTANALLFHLESKSAFVLSCMTVCLAGWGDELLQILMPRRAFEFRDVFMNGAAGVFGVLFRQTVSYPCHQKEA